MGALRLNGCGWRRFRGADLNWKMLIHPPQQNVGIVVKEITNMTEFLLLLKTPEPLTHIFLIFSPQDRKRISLDMLIIFLKKM